MSFPNIIYARYGDEKIASSAAQNDLRLGQRMMLPDGREFAYAKVGGTALATGVLCNMPAPTDADLLLNTIGGAAVGATTVAASCGATAGVATDELKDGYLMSFKGGTAGYMYKIKSNNSAAAAVTTQIVLYEYDALKAPMAAGTTYVFINRSPFDGVNVRPASTQATGVLAGVTANSVAASSYFWIQRRGVCCVLTADTLGLVGEPVVANTATAGAVSRVVIDADTTTVGDFKIGRLLVAPGTNTDYAMIYLDLEKCR